MRSWTRSWTPGTPRGRPLDHGRHLAPEPHLPRRRAAGGQPHRGRQPAGMGAEHHRPRRGHPARGVRPRALPPRVVPVALHPPRPRVQHAVGHRADSEVHVRLRPLLATRDARARESTAARDSIRSESTDDLEIFPSSTSPSFDARVLTSPPPPLFRRPPQARATRMVLHPPAVEARAFDPPPECVTEAPMRNPPDAPDEEGGAQAEPQEAQRRVHGHHEHRPDAAARGRRPSPRFREQSQRGSARRVPHVSAAAEPEPAAGGGPAQDGPEGGAAAVRGPEPPAHPRVRRRRHRGVDPADDGVVARDRPEAARGDPPPRHGQRPGARVGVGRRVQQRSRLGASAADARGAPRGAGPLGGEHHAEGPAGAAAVAEEERQDGGRGVQQGDGV